jgi:hypothetical protein
MLEDFFKRWKQLREEKPLSPDAEASPYMNLEGLEKKIKVPEPTKPDKAWAKKAKHVAGIDAGKALQLAIETGQNWRVWYLLNRPLREAGKLIPGGNKDGFENKDLSDGIKKAAETDNVTAAYLLLKYAEKYHTTFGGAADRVREELHNYTMTGLQQAAEKKGGDVYTLLAQTYATLKDEDMHPGAAYHVVDYQKVLKEAAIRAAAQGNEKHLDAMLDNRLLEPKQFVEAFMESFMFGPLGKDAAGADNENITPQGRKPFLDWMAKRGMVDQIFVDEALNVEVRMGDARNACRAACEKGWKHSRRELPAQDGQQKPDMSQVEITKPGADGAITYVFNFNAARAHKITGALVQEMPLDRFPDRALVEEARSFLECSSTGAPQLVWKKGEPFRLRFGPPTP